MRTARLALAHARADAWYAACSCGRGMRPIAVAFGGSLAVAAAAFACGGTRAPTPAYVRQPTSALVEVPYPPPPARVEFVPERPQADAVWLDGEWVWQGRRYAWKPGRWVLAPPNASFAPWTSVRNARGTLYLAEGTWRDAKGAEVPAPKILKVGAPSAGAVTNPEGEVIANPATTAADASTARADAEATSATRAPRDIIVDSGPDFRPDATQLPDGTLAPSDASLLPEAAGFDAMIDATPLERDATMVKP